MRKQGRRLRRHGFLLPCSQRGFGGALDAAEAMFVERAAEAADDHPAEELRVAEAHLGLAPVAVHVPLARRPLPAPANRGTPFPAEQAALGAPPPPPRHPPHNRAPPPPPNQQH